MNRKSGNSVRGRLIRLNMAVLALVIFAMAATLRMTLQLNLTNAVDRDMQSRTNMMLQRWYGLGDERRDFLLAAVRLRPSRQVAEAFQVGTMAGTGSPFYPPRILTNHGRNYLTDQPAKAWDSRAYRQSLRGRSVFSSIVVDGTPVRIYSTPIRRDGAVDGVAQMAQPLTEVHAEISMVTKTLLALIPVALLAVGAGSAFLADRALRPVRRMARVAQEISANDLSRRLDVGGADEFASLARTFNSMLERLEDSFGKLEDAYRRQQQFTGDVSHELRTPLTVIKANTSLALTGSRSTEEYRDALTAADRASDSMNDIMQNLLLLARAESGRLPIELAPVAVAGLVQSAVAALPAGPTQISVLPSLDALTVIADANCLRRVIDNLLANAVRHTPADGNITVSGVKTGKIVDITIADTGEGIPAEHLPRITERFYRCDNARSRTDGGVGLGLAICKNIVTAHGGELTIVSTVGVGTTVTVRLPAG